MRKTTDGFSPLPDQSHIRWRRLDVPGREHARITRLSEGWCLAGEVEVVEEGIAAHLRYTIECDHHWHTRVAIVEGEAGNAAVAIALEADGAGHWTRQGIPIPGVAGTLDIDLGFTPATNTLPIRRLGLAMGESAPVRTAWLRFPELRLEPLDQVYAREGVRRFRYRSTVDGEPFTAALDTDDFGRVVRYGDLWIAEADLRDEASPERRGHHE